MLKTTVTQTNPSLTEEQIIPSVLWESQEPIPSGIWIPAHAPDSTFYILSDGSPAGTGGPGCVGVYYSPEGYISFHHPDKGVYNCPWRRAPKGIVITFTAN